MPLAVVQSRAGLTHRASWTPVPSQQHRARQIVPSLCRASPQRGPAGPGPDNRSQSLLEQCDSFLQRYDLLSTGMGAMCVTSYFVYFRHQEPALALAITLGATVAGLVLSELLGEGA